MQLIVTYESGIIDTIGNSIITRVQNNSPLSSINTGTIMRLLSLPMNSKLILNIFHALCSLSKNPMMRIIWSLFKNFATHDFYVTKNFILERLIDC